VQTAIAQILGSLVQDLRFSLRTLAKNRAFTAVTALTLALGIGANTAIFSVVDAVLLQDLPYPHPETLVRIVEHETTAGDVMVSYPDFLDWQQQSPAFASLAVYHSDDYNLTGVDEPVRLRGLQVSAGFFPTVGVGAARGRTFRAAEDRPGARPVAVLTQALWRSRYGADPGILGRSLMLNGVSYTVIGVLPAGFWLPQKVDLVVPFGPVAAGPDWLQRGEHNGLRAVARLAPGVSLTQAGTSIRTVMARLARQYPRSNSGETAYVKTFHELVVRDVRPTLYVLLAAVGFVLLTACANVANLLLARASERQKEMAVRAALGSGRRRLVQQALCECVVLSVLGGGLGLALAAAAVRPLLALAPGDIPRLESTQVDVGVLAFATVVSLLAGLLFGIVPALQASRPEVIANLKQGTRGGSAGRGGARLRNGVLVAEVAMALILATGAGLMIRSIVRVQRQPVGFAPDHLLTFGVRLPDARYARPEQQALFFKQALERLAAVPGVRSAATVRCLPMAGACWDSGYTLGDRPVPPPEEMPELDSNMVSSDYFQTLGIPVVSGRVFTPNDNLEAPPVVVVNQTLARRLWPHGSPIGQRLKQGLPDEPEPWREIVGVVGDVRREGVDAKQDMEVFMPIAQHNFWQGQARFVVRTAQSPMSAAGAAAAAIHSLDRDQPLTDVEPLAQYMAESLARRNFSTLLLGLFGGVALTLAAIGIYGVMAYTVSLRLREMGIRMALGAQRTDILRLVVGQGLGLAAIGVAAGLLGSLAVTHLMTKLLFGVSPTDPATFAGAALLLGAVAVLASFLPARRATEGDPAAALHVE
jgi:putative ABC transport system permease protein